MGLVGRAGAAGVVSAALTSCYAPDLRDCVVACTAAADCAPDHTCGADGLCARAHLAGRCALVGEPDARRADARRIDSPAPPDAVWSGLLHVQITGRGDVRLDPGIGDDCTSNNAAGASCSYPAAVGMSVDLEPKEDHSEFVGWSHPACSGVWTCQIVVGAGTTVVGASFTSDD